MAAAQPPRKRRKLTGRAFFESIGSPKMVLAPMVDQSEFAWRLLTRSYLSPESSNGLLAYTPMFHSRMFCETAKFRDLHFQPTRASLRSHPSSEHHPSNAYLDGNPANDRPLFVQFCANDPDDFLDAAKYVEPYCDAVDLNLGCPQNIARRGIYGAFLQEDWDLIYKLINKLNIHLDVPVTAKMRILETKEKTLEYAKMILSAGASILTVHGRQRDQKGHNTGIADWTVIRYLRDHLPPETVIFANGNILCHDDIQKCLEKTGADGVMSAEGNLCDPTIFARPPAVGEEGREYWRGRDGRGGFRMDAVFRRYLDIIYKHILEKPPPERKPLFIPSDPFPNGDATSPDLANNEVVSAEPPRKSRKAYKKQQMPTPRNLIAIQSHLFHLLRPLVTKHTNVRDALAKARPQDIQSFEHVLHLTEAAVKEGLVDYASNPAAYEDNPTATEEAETTQKENASDEDRSAAAAARACKRPWWVCQPYIRPLPKEAIAKGSLTISQRDKKRKLEEDAALSELQTRLDNTSARETADDGERDGVLVAEQEGPKRAMVCG